MKRDIYDWPDKYDDALKSMLQFTVENLSMRNMADLCLPMEAHSTPLREADFSKEYDMAKDYDKDSYISMVGGPKTLQGLVIKENYGKMLDGRLQKWSSSDMDNCDQRKNKRYGMGSETYRKMFDMGIVVNMENVNELKRGLNSNEVAVVDNMCQTKADIDKFLSHYFIVIDRLMELVGNLGLVHCYKNLYAPHKNDDSQVLKNQGINTSSNKAKEERNLPLISVCGSKIPDDAFIACIHDTVATSNGWRIIADIRKIVRLKFFSHQQCGVLQNGMLAVIIGGCLAIKRLITWKIVIGDGKNLYQAAEILSPILENVDNNGWVRRSNGEKIMIMLEHIDDVCGQLDDEVKIADFFIGDMDITLTRAKRILVQSEEITYECLYRVLSVMLSDKSGICRLCMDKHDTHECITITVRSWDYALFSLQCHNRKEHFNKYMESKS